MVKKPAKKQRRRSPDETRARLLQATVTLMSRKGADALTVKEAAQVAKVSRAVAYQHFKDRNHLLREAKKWISDQLMQFVSEYGPGSSEERMFLTTKLILSNLEAAKLLVADSLAGTGISDDNPLYKMLRKNLRKLKTEGQGRKDIDVEMMSLIMLGAVPSTIMLGMRHANGNIDTLARRFSCEFTRMLHHGLFTQVLPLGVKSSIPAKAPSGNSKTSTSRARSPRQSKV